MPDYSVQEVNRLLCRQFFGNDEEALPLTQEERDLAAIIHPIVVKFINENLKKSGNDRNNENLKKRESDRNGNNIPLEDISFKERISLTRENLRIIIKKFADSDLAYQQFVNDFPSYEKICDTNIAKLREVAAAINLDRQNSNISQVTGSSVGFLGCGVIGSSLIFPPAALALIIGGGIAAGLGAAVTIGTSITEAVLLKQKTEEAKKILEATTKEAEKMEKWFTHSLEFVAAVEVVLSMSMMKNLADSLRGLVKGVSDFNSKFKNSIKYFIEKLFESQDISPAVAPTVAITITTLCVLFVLRSRRHLIYDMILFTSHLFYAFTNGLEISVEITRMIAQIFMKGGSQAVGKMSANMARIVFHGVFAGVSMALDLINIIFASIDLSRGSVSEYATQITTSADAIQKELDLMRDIYKGVIARAQS